MFGMSWGEILIVITVGMFVLGPERIPVAVKWVGSTLKTVRTMAAGAQEQLQGEFGPELEELKRQIADLQSLKEIQELRSLRDLNPRSLITKNILGDEFSGGFSGLLGLNQTTGTPQATGSGVAAEPQQVAAEPQPVVAVGPQPAPREADETKPDLFKQVPSESVQIPAVSAPSVEPAPQVPAVTINEPVVMTTEVMTTEVMTTEVEPAPIESAPRHLAAASFDSDAT